MDTTVDEDIYEAKEYADAVSFLPLYPLDENYDKLLALFARVRPKDWSRIFWEIEDGSITQQVFLGYMQRATLIALGFVDQRIACAWWIGGMSGQGETSRCELSGWFPFEARGVGSEYLLRAILRYLHETLGIQSIYMRSPWRTVQSLCDRAELATVAEIKRYYIRGRPETLRIFRSEKTWATD